MRSHLDSDAYVIEDPQLLASSEGMDLETYTLARVIVSEAGTKSRDVQAAIAWAVVNESARKGMSIFQRTTLTRDRGQTGKFGSQYHPITQDNRYVSTAKDPAQAHMSLAREIADGKITDPTDGATQFFEPALHDQLHAAGRPGYEKTAAEVLASWTKKGTTYQQVGDWVFLKHGGDVPGELPINLATPSRTISGGKVVAALIGLGTAGAIAYAASQEDE